MTTSENENDDDRKQTKTRTTTTKEQQREAEKKKKKKNGSSSSCGFAKGFLLSKGGKGKGERAASGRSRTATATTTTNAGAGGDSVAHPQRPQQQQTDERQSVRAGGPEPTPLPSAAEASSSVLLDWTAQQPRSSPLSRQQQQQQERQQQPDRRPENEEEKRITLMVPSTTTTTTTFSPPPKADDVRGGFDDEGVGDDDYQARTARLAQSLGRLRTTTSAADNNNDSGRLLPRRDRRRSQIRWYPALAVECVDRVFVVPKATSTTSPPLSSNRHLGDGGGDDDDDNNERIRCLLRNLLVESSSTPSGDGDVVAIETKRFVVGLLVHPRYGEASLREVLQLLQGHAARRRPDAGDDVVEEGNEQRQRQQKERRRCALRALRCVEYWVEAMERDARCIHRGRDKHDDNNRQQQLRHTMEQEATSDYFTRLLNCAVPVFVELVLALQLQQKSRNDTTSSSRTVLAQEAVDLTWRIVGDWSVVALQESTVIDADGTSASPRLLQLLQVHLEWAEENARQRTSKPTCGVECQRAVLADWHSLFRQQSSAVTKSIDGDPEFCLSLAGIRDLEDEDAQVRLSGFGGIKQTLLSSRSVPTVEWETILSRLKKASGYGTSTRSSRDNPELRLLLRGTLSWLQPQFKRKKIAPKLPRMLSDPSSLLDVLTHTLRISSSLSNLDMTATLVYVHVAVMGSSVDFFLKYSCNPPLIRFSCYYLSLG